MRSLLIWVLLAFPFGQALSSEGDKCFKDTTSALACVEALYVTAEQYNVIPKDWNTFAEQHCGNETVNAFDIIHCPFDHEKATPLEAVYTRECKRRNFMFIKIELVKTPDNMNIYCRNFRIREYYNLRLKKNGRPEFF